jgi:hypothetical protein
MDTTSNAGTSNEPAIRFAGSELSARHYIGGFFRTPEEAYRLLLPFIKEGFERGEKAFHHNRMLIMWQEVLDGAARQGFPLTRLVAPMEWALRSVRARVA